MVDLWLSFSSYSCLIFLPKSQQSNGNYLRRTSEQVFAFSNLEKTHPKGAMSRLLIYEATLLYLRKWLKKESISLFVCYHRSEKIECPWGLTGRKILDYFDPDKYYYLDISWWERRKCWCWNELLKVARCKILIKKQLSLWATDNENFASVTLPDNSCYLYETLLLAI